MRTQALLLSALIALNLFPKFQAAPASIPALRGLGLVVAEEKATVSAEISARVESRRVREHEPVKKGQIIFGLDRRTKAAEFKAAEADVLDAQARVELAQSELVRAKRLSRSDVSSAAELDRAGAEAKRAQAALLRSQAANDLAQYALDRTEIRAPFDGVIVEYFAEESEFLRPGSKLFSIVSLTSLRIECQVETSQIRSFEKLKISLVEKGADKRPLQIRSIAPSSSNRSRTFKVIFEVPAALLSGPGRLRPGMRVGWIGEAS